MKPLNFFNTYTKEELLKYSDESLELFTRTVLKQLKQNDTSEANLLILANANLLKLVCPEFFLIN